MKSLVVKLSILAVFLAVSGCSTLNYQTTETFPDGRVLKRVVEFSSLGSTDSATGQLSKDEKITIKGQQGIDPALLLQLITALGAVQ